MTLAQGLILAIVGISVSSATDKQSPLTKEVRSVPEYVLKYAYDHAENPGGNEGNKFLDEHSTAEEDTKRITRTNTVFFKHKIIPVHYPVYSYFDYPLEKIPHSVPHEKKFSAEHPVIRPEVKIVPFSEEKKIEHTGKNVKLVHFHYPDEKEVAYTNPVHYFEQLSYPHFEKEEVPFKLEKEVVHPFHLEKTVPFEILYPYHEEEKLTVPLVEATPKDEIKKEEIHNPAAAKKEGEITHETEKTNSHLAQLQKEPPNNPEDQSGSKEKEKAPETHPIQVNIPLKQLGKEVQVTPFVIKFEIPKEEEKAEGEDTLKMESTKE